jgi:hypothetical protein
LRKYELGTEAFEACLAALENPLASLVARLVMSHARWNDIVEHVAVTIDDRGPVVQVAAEEAARCKLPSILEKIRKGLDCSDVGRGLRRCEALDPVEFGRRLQALDEWSRLVANLALVLTPWGDILRVLAAKIKGTKYPPSAVSVANAGVMIDQIIREIRDVLD